jgi:hypothetical protein
MTKQQVAEAVEDRLVKRWKKRCLDAGAAPICLVAVTQTGINAGQPMVCLLEDLDTNIVADFLTAIAVELRKEVG